MPRVLEGQVAIVTGGGRGIGRIIARSLAGAGAAVAVVARSRGQVEECATLIERDGGRALAWVADVRDLAAMEEMVAEVEQRLGPVTLLVNNAGTGSAIGPTWEVDPDLWWQDVEVLLRGAQLCSRAVLPGMIARGRGRIVNMCRRAGAVGVPHQTGYSCSRAALFQLSEGMARELEPHGIAVFPFTPGVVRTDMTEFMLDSEPGRRWLSFFQAMMEDGSAWVTPESVGDAAVALAAGRADGLSGRWIHAQDDLEEMIDRASEIREGDRRALRLRK
jgi:NAD(P)-dependent dehydrogenase (short-subunit alcohol dehydrogenase family)